MCPACPDTHGLTILAGAEHAGHGTTSPLFSQNAGFHPKGELFSQEVEGEEEYFALKMILWLQQIKLHFRLNKDCVIHCVVQRVGSGLRSSLDHHPHHTTSWVMIGVDLASLKFKILVYEVEGLSPSRGWFEDWKSSGHMKHSALVCPAHGQHSVIVSWWEGIAVLVSG